MRAANRYTNRLFVEHDIDLTKDQWLVLKKVNDDKEEGISPFEIAKLLDKEAASMTRILDILERKQLLKRAPNPNDRRSSLVFPTQRGINVYQQVLPLVKDIRRKVVEGITPNEVIQLRRFLVIMEENMR
ncbi:MAG: MarR family transcriptional regulator [Bacteroidota bacterium]